MLEKKKKYQGIIFIILSSFSFAWMNVFVRLSGDLPVFEKSFFRNLVAAVFALAMVLKQKEKIVLKKEDWRDFILRSFFGTMGILCNFYAIDHMVVSDASLLNKLSPFFVLIFSFLLLKEKVKPIQVGYILLAFFGVLFVMKPGMSEVNPLPALVGVAGGMCAGLAYTFVRKLGTRGVAGPMIVLFFSAFSTIAMIPFFLSGFQMMSLTQLLCLLGAGLAATGGQFGITAAYSCAPAREISIYDYSQIIFVTLISFFLLGEVPDGFSVVGYVIITGASLGMFLYNRRRN